jgi:hypothetical protein
MKLAMDKQRKKELAATYTEQARPMGVYQIRNTTNEKIWVSSSMDLPGARNRLAFMKQMGMCSIHEIKPDWERFGPDAFVFEELDQVPLPEADGTTGGVPDLKQLQEDVDFLLHLWLEKLEPYGDKGYNKPKRRP